MKSFALLLCAAGLISVPARANVSFTIVDNVFTEVDQASAHTEQAWDFATLPGWYSGLNVVSVTVTETFSLILPGGTPFAPNFQSTIITDANPLGSQSKIFTIFAAQAPTVTETTILTPGVGGFTVADITTGGVLGEFATRIARNGGGFLADTMTITIDGTTPEPTSIFLMGLGLFVIAVWRGQRPVTSRMTRR
jgi:hypothetical protein